MAGSVLRQAEQAEPCCRRSRMVQPRSDVCSVLPVGLTALPCRLTHCWWNPHSSLTKTTLGSHCCPQQPWPLPPLFQMSLRAAGHLCLPSHVARFPPYFCTYPLYTHTHTHPHTHSCTLLFTSLRKVFRAAILAWGTCSFLLLHSCSPAFGRLSTHHVPGDEAPFPTLNLTSHFALLSAEKVYVSRPLQARPLRGRHPVQPTE